MIDIRIVISVCQDIFAHCNFFVRPMNHNFFFLIKLIFRTFHTRFKFSNEYSHHIHLTHLSGHISRIYPTIWRRKQSALTLYAKNHSKNGNKNFSQKSFSSRLLTHSNSKCHHYNTTDKMNNNTKVLIFFKG